MSDELFAFHEPEADALLDSLERGGHVVSNSRSRRSGIVFGKTKSGGLAANTLGKVYLREPNSTGTGFVDTTKEIDAWNDSAAIAGDKKLILITINGVLCAFEVC